MAECTAFGVWRAAGSSCPRALAEPLHAKAVGASAGDCGPTRSSRGTMARSARRRSSWSGAVSLVAAAVISLSLCSWVPTARAELKTSLTVTPPFDKHDHRGSRIIPYWEKSGDTNIMQSFVRVRSFFTPSNQRVCVRVCRSLCVCVSACVCFCCCQKSRSVLLRGVVGCLSLPAWRRGSGANNMPEGCSA